MRFLCCHICVLDFSSHDMSLKTDKKVQRLYWVSFDGDVQCTELALNSRFGTGDWSLFVNKFSFTSSFIWYARLPPWLTSSGGFLFFSCLPSFSCSVNMVPVKNEIWIQSFIYSCVVLHRTYSVVLLVIVSLNMSHFLTPPCDSIFRFDLSL